MFGLTAGGCASVAKEAANWRRVHMAVSLPILCAPDRYDEGVRKVLLLSTLAITALLGMDPAARDVKTVYILKMGSGLDQFLASELTKAGVYTVTTDAQKADAVFTDSLGEGFEKKLKELYPPPPPPAPAKTEGKKDEKKDNAMIGDSTPRLGNSTMGRGKGTIFLVERKSHNLLWSMNRQPKNSGAQEMVGQARKIVEQLKKDLGLTPAK